MNTNKDVSLTIKEGVKEQAKCSLKGVNLTYGNHKLLLLWQEIVAYYIFIYICILSLCSFEFRIAESLSKRRESGFRCARR